MTPRFVIQLQFSIRSNAISFNVSIKLFVSGVRPACLISDFDKIFI
jgi:hypothetical protein